ncbi:DUF983 domain-containing protein [Sinomicrobium pectinilyticum]|uniref:DUF983 domain-containing protein n=1 Tax=Sinomicrobium pectinilyticum TaxID=1084421 RepID=A0A3N0F540_SINP1|nr:DUF983 domain-containing protein [Sinomicrobium pectinilyticum]RNL95092.1 DUF983 domain-containing protein [Sinomicrobium pectinilyticum]
MADILYILKEKCPNCEKGDIFESKGNPFLFRMPKMHRRCHNCDYNFIREPGYFFGAMYVSYALTIAEMVAVLILGKFVIGLGNIYIFVIIMIMAVVSSTFNFRLSRTIWLYMFRKKKTPGHIEV